MGYRVIYIEKCEYLRLYLDNLKVEIKNDTLLIPVSDIQILVIDNYQSNLSVPLINKLTDNNVCTIICGVDHLSIPLSEVHAICYRSPHNPLKKSIFFKS